MKGNYDIREYARGDRRGKEANRLERQAVSDPFLHEALEGYREVGGDLSADIDRLGRRIARRAGRAARLRRIAVAQSNSSSWMESTSTGNTRPAVPPVSLLHRRTSKTTRF